ncbi:GntR family transcriptional regulator [Streptomyces sp. AD2-2]|nr:GntR family transcriptional regulator [Streptomyces sp. AD2-2]
MAYDVEAPKYVRLAQTLQGRIEDGTYAPGTRVPSENQLVQAFGMSRPTVVRALELLKRDGWLESRQGYGTIVRGRPAVVEQKDRRGVQRSHVMSPGSRGGWLRSAVSPFRRASPPRSGCRSAPRSSCDDSWSRRTANPSSWSRLTSPRA